MPIFKIKAVPLVAKVLSLRRTSTNSQQQQQQQKQTITQENEPPQLSDDTSESKEGIPSPNNDKARLKRRREPSFLHMNTVKMLLAVLVVSALLGMIPLYRGEQKKLEDPDEHKKQEDPDEHKKPEDLGEHQKPEDPGEHPKPEDPGEHKKPQDTGVKVIMLWNEEPSKIFKASVHMECGCMVTNRDKNFEKPVDAFVFNADRPYNMRYISQMNRTPEFLSVFAARNPLSMAKNPPPHFNLTMTYRLDSQLVWSEFFLSVHNQAKRVNSFRAPSAHYADDMPGFEMQLVDNQTSIKDRLVMYVIYEVEEATTAQSLYLEELRKYTSLDAYPSFVHEQNCNRFYFLLIFETSACPDYVPTQMYEAMYKFVVPVLIGGGNLNNVVPPHSYISSRDFSNPKDLVAHLKYLVKTPVEYKRYFWWHSFYKLRRNPLPYCQLCYFLQQPQEERRIETSFSDWWTRNQCPEPLTTFL